MRHAPGHSSRRAGFTLVELLVVIAIIIVLAALLLMFYPSISSQTAEANGAANFQGWLNIARQKAIRGQNPFGLRLWIKDLTTMYVTECSYIEQPEDIRGSVAPLGGPPTGGTIVTRDWLNIIPPPPAGSGPIWNAIAITPGTFDPTGGFGPADPTLWLVQPGDYIEVLGTGVMHQITGISTGPYVPQGYPWNPNPAPIPGPFMTLGSPIPFQIGQFDPRPLSAGGSGAAANATGNFRIMRQPRVIGEETLPLPDGVVIDINVNLNNNPALGQPYMLPIYANPLPLMPLYGPPNPPNPPLPVGSYVDVLFGPSGGLLTQGLTRPTLNFWVRQPDTANPSNIFAGTPSVIAVFAGTGQTGAYNPAPIVVPAVNPYMDIQ